MPTRAVNVAVAAASFAGPPSAATLPSSAPVRIAKVVVELTLRTRDEPRVCRRLNVLGV